MRERDLGKVIKELERGFREDGMVEFNWFLKGQERNKGMMLIYMVVMIAVMV